MKTRTRASAVASLRPFSKLKFLTDKTSEFPISIDKLKSLRDCITHGSINKIDSEELEKTNKFLYRINGILILNLMDINAWKLNTEL